MYYERPLYSARITVIGANSSSGMFINIHLLSPLPLSYTFLSKHQSSSTANCKDPTCLLMNGTLSTATSSSSTEQPALARSVQLTVADNIACLVRHCHQSSPNGTEQRYGPRLPTVTGSHVDITRHLLQDTNITRGVLSANEKSTVGSRGIKKDTPNRKCRISPSFPGPFLVLFSSCE